VTVGPMFFAPGAGGGGGISTSHWRLLITSSDGGSVISAAEVQFRAAAGGASLCVGGTASASSVYWAGTEADKAFDENNSTLWAAATSVNQWIAYALTAASAVNQVMIRSRQDAAANQSPRDFKVQSSANGTTWTDEWTVSGSTGWGLGETRLYTRP
jgi:hypothetical protein